MLLPAGGLSIGISLTLASHKHLLPFLYTRTHTRSRTHTHTCIYLSFSLSHTHTQTHSRRPIKYLYDGNCSMCLGLINVLQRNDYANMRISYVNILNPGYKAKQNMGIEVDDAMKTIHVIHPDGTVSLLCWHGQKGEARWEGKGADLEVIADKQSPVGL